MPTYDLVFNVAKGRAAELALTANAVIAVPLQTTGIVSAATMRDYATLADLLAGATDEQTTMGRKTLTGVVSTLDQSGDTSGFDASDVTWTAAAGPGISAVVVCAKPASGSADSAIVPLVIVDAVTTPAGGDITVQWNAAGVFRAS